LRLQPHARELPVVHAEARFAVLVFSQGQVAPDQAQVTDVEHEEWSGRVFNLQTASGWYCIGRTDIVVQNCLHSEENAIINCTAPRYAPKVVFVTHLPCVACAKRLINLGGVQTVYYGADYRIRDSLKLFHQSKIEAVMLTL
jgi:deoxycytidylate deaminase